jgi:membrane protein
MRRRSESSIIPWDPSTFRGPLRTLITFARFVETVLKQLRAKNCFVRASGLAYSSLLAIVPLTTIILSLFTAFGSFQEVKKVIDDFLIRQLIPTSHEVILRLLDSFIENSKTLGVAGLLLFGITSVLLLDSINSHFNAIWGSHSRKRFLGKFTTYTSIIVVGSLLVSVGFGISTLAREILPGRAAETIPFLERAATRMAPAVFIFVGILLMVTLIPQARVRFTSALVGALSGALLWEFVRYWFMNLTDYVFRMSVVYGSLAVIPIFLFWLYLTWIIILSSLVVTFTHQHRRSIWTGGNVVDRLPSQQLLFGMEVLRAIASPYISGSRPPSTEDLARSFAGSISDITRFVSIFEDAGLILLVQKRNGWVPAKPLTDIRIDTVLSLLYGPAIAPGEDPTPTQALLTRFGRSAFAAVEGETLAELLKRTP